jgi:guanylate kinase
MKNGLSEKMKLRLQELDLESDEELPSLPVVICGPSGVGKSTLIRRLLKEFPKKFYLAVSHTTRAPRKGEKDGVDYHFVTQEEFEKIDFLEHASFAGNSYGTAKGELNRDLVVILDLNIDGVVSIEREGISAIFMLILPPSNTELKARLKKRGTSPECIEKRMKEATRLENECERVNWNKILINDNLETAYKEFKNFILVE